MEKSSSWFGITVVSKVTSYYYSIKWRAVQRVFDCNANFWLNAQNQHKKYVQKEHILRAHAVMLIPYLSYRKTAKNAREKVPKMMYNLLNFRLCGGGI
jgi:hypothetical protein